MLKFPAQASRNGRMDLLGRLDTGSAGAVAATTHCEGFSVAKTGSEAGRYTITLDDAWPYFWGLDVTPVGAADAAWTTAKGIGWFVRNVDMASRTIDLQFYVTASTADSATPPVITNTQPDTELPDNTKVYLILKVSSE